MEKSAAETVALQALRFIVAEDDRLSAFLNITGLDEAALMSGAGDSSFLAGILDYILASEPLLIEFCQEETIPFDMPLRARNAFPGGSFE